MVTNQSKSNNDGSIELQKLFYKANLFFKTHQLNAALKILLDLHCSLAKEQKKTNKRREKQCQRDIVDICFLLGRIYLSLKEYDTASSYFNYVSKRQSLSTPSRLLEYSPDDAYFYRAQALYGMGNYKEAIQDCVQISEHKNSADLFLLKARLYFQNHQYNLANYFCDKMLILDPASIEANFLKAEVACELYKNDHSDNPLTTVLALLDKVVKVNPEFKPALYLRAEIFFQQQEFQKAIRDLNAIEPKCFKTRFLRMYAYAALGNLPASLLDCDALMELQPDNQDLHRHFNNLTNALKDEGYELNILSLGYKYLQQNDFPATQECLNLVTSTRKDIVERKTELSTKMTQVLAHTLFALKPGLQSAEDPKPGGCVRGF
ncbi:tetratricopeptide repeat protein [Legionella dresdenensis]|uniref:Tetratricopeptide repeat protein n=1 Tax=Legionella dresdenensis TaxID=450200 RepID=A0ABV8CCK3_9GAMM